MAGKFYRGLVRVHAHEYDRGRGLPGRCGCRKPTFGETERFARVTRTGARGRSIYCDGLLCNSLRCGLIINSTRVSEVRGGEPPGVRR